MYFRALEIQGFKSFPDKTTLTFDKDITAIVGPNGSGKSNISDAVRWVLGEQSSKSLRGTKMEDVIFGGTQKRPQLGFAEVSLVLDNSAGELPVDTAEVMITRRYYRSGESEYFINRQSARLRDINELFMDTGLGREGYSNIGQGRIDEILSQKSTDRREIFEEAAGISKYRYRKTEAERKLEATEQNLLRVNDKIAELELQVEPLKRQAETARRYLGLREQLRSSEVTVWLAQLDTLAQTAQKADEDYRSAAFVLQQGQEELESLYRRAEELTGELRQQDAALEQLRQRAAALEADRMRSSSDGDVLQATLDGNLASMERARQELESETERAGQLEQQIAARRARLEEIAAQMDALAGQIEQAEQEQHSQQQAQDALSAQLSELAAQIAARQETLGQVQQTLSARSASEQEVMDREETVRRDRSEAMARRAEAGQAAADCQARLDEAKKTAQTVRNQIAGYTLRQKARDEAAARLQQSVTAGGVELDTLRARIGLLGEMERDYEGYNKAVKLVMQQANRGGLGGIHGPVADLIRVRDDYTIAIETALGASMQSVVVDSEQSGKAAINWLKRRDGGRATFLPMSAIRGRGLEERGLEQRPGFVGVASALVEYDGQYRPIIENLLGRIVIVEDLDRAVPIAQAYGYRFRIVTLDGQVLNSGGSMTGGSVSRSAGILSRANELNRLKQRQGTLEQRQQTLQKQLTEAQSAAAKVRFELETAQGELRGAEDAILRLEGEQRQHEAICRAIESSIAAGERELAALKERMEGGRELMDSLTAQRQSLTDALAALHERQQALLARQEEQTQAQAAQRAGLTRLQMDRSALEAEQTAAAESAGQLAGLMEQMSGDSAGKAQRIAQYEAENADLQARIAACRGQADQLSAQLDELRRQQTAQTEERQRTEARRTGTDRKAQEKNKELLALQGEAARLEQKKAAAALEEKQIVDKLWDNYELTRTTARNLTPAEGTLPALQKQIQELRRKISALGTPNLGAIEEYARVNERYTYLTNQRDDVESGRRDLLGVIRDITGEMTAIFREEFQKINESFQKTFVEMFGGGRASLKLEDEHNVLDCGIEIQVQPPGKAVKTLTLLSGGEKAFVAAALYFAILQVRPTPFCLLDEIDAALDDRNVARYAAYLRTLSDRTQFIVITHRRGTMEAADVLYGVTMQEQGVSKLLALDLDAVEAEYVK